MEQGDQEIRRKTGVLWGLSQKVLAACIEVHRRLGPGLLESAYHACLCRELELRGIAFDAERPLPVQYKGVHLECGYRVDLVIEEQLLVELKSVAELMPVHKAQVLTYLKLTNLGVGLLVNFNTTSLRRGVRRLTRTPTRGWPLRPPTEPKTNPSRLPPDLLISL